MSIHPGYKLPLKFKFLLLLFIVAIIKDFSPNFSIINYAYNGLCLLFASYLIILSKKKWRLKIILVILFVFMLIRGLNNYYIFLLADIGKYSLVFILFFYSIYENKNKELFILLINWFAKLLYILLPLCIILLSFYGISPAELNERNISSIDNSFKPSNLISLSIYFLPFISYINGRKKYLIVISVLIGLMLSVFSASRGGTFIYITSILFTLIYTKGVNSTFKKQFVFFSIIGFFIIFLIWGPYRLNNSFVNLYTRTFKSADFSNGRNIEETLYLSSINIEELIIGKGFGGANKTWIWQDTEYGMPMAHKGYIYQIMKGGLAWASLYYIFSFIMLYKLFKSKDIFINKLTFILLILLISELFFHTIWLSPTNLILFFLVLSYSYNLKETPRSFD